MSTGTLAVIIVTVIGIVCAVMLSVASKVMAVKEDPLIPLVRECLPGANCGACGFSSELLLPFYRVLRTYPPPFSLQPAQAGFVFWVLYMIQVYGRPIRFATS